MSTAEDFSGHERREPVPYPQDVLAFYDEIGDQLLANHPDQTTGLGAEHSIEERFELTDGRTAEVSFIVQPKLVRVSPNPAQLPDRWLPSGNVKVLSLDSDDVLLTDRYFFGRSLAAKTHNPDTPYIIKRSYRGDQEVAAKLLTWSEITELENLVEVLGEVAGVLGVGTAD